MTSQSTPTPRVLLTVEQAADALGIGRTNMFALIKSGEIESVKVGRLRRVPATAIETYTAHLAAEQNPTL
jgi:excisionase family DNA binding protein